MKKQEPQYVINVRLGPKLAEKLDELAYRTRTTRTETIRLAVAEYLEKRADGTQS